MNELPTLRELHQDDDLVIKFEDVSCLAGPSFWVLELHGRDTSSLVIRTAGPRAVPAVSKIHLDEEQRSWINDLLLRLPSYISFGATSYCSFEVLHYRAGCVIADWQFARVLPRAADFETLHRVRTLCHTVPHEYRKPTAPEKIRLAVAAVLMAPIVIVIMIVAGLALLAREVRNLLRR